MIVCRYVEYLKIHTMKGIFKKKKKLSISIPPHKPHRYINPNAHLLPTPYSHPPSKPLNTLPLPLSLPTLLFNSSTLLLSLFSTPTLLSASLA